MQPLEIISVNLWQMVISLCNLVILFLILKKFLYKPVKKVLAQRQAAVDEQYAAARQAEEAAAAEKAAWEEKMQTAQDEADALIQAATVTAGRRGEEIVAQAQEKADRLVRQAQADAQLEMEKAQSAVKQEIVDISALLAEKMLQREIKTADHRTLIDAFIGGIDDGDA